jgi:hypothetical protein
MNWFLFGVALSAFDSWSLVLMMSLAVSILSFYHGLDCMHVLVLGARMSTTSWMWFVRYVAEASKIS